MTTTPLFLSSSNGLQPCAEIRHWLNQDAVMRRRLDALGLISPGMYVFALTRWPELGYTRSDMDSFLKLGARQQLAELGLPPLPAVARLLSKLRINQIDSQAELDALRAWLQRREGRLPKVVLHAPAVHFSYLQALIRQPRLASLPYPTAMDLDPDGLGDMNHLERLVRDFMQAASKLHYSHPKINYLLKKVRWVEHMEDLVYETERELLRVPVRLQPDSFIWVPQSYREFKRLAAEQKNCVDLYFDRVARGECQIVAVGTNKQVSLTAEIRTSEDGFWYPAQVLSQRNTLPQRADLLRLLRWLAVSQLKNSQDFCYRRNLIRLMHWASRQTLNSHCRTTREDHWFVQVEVLAELIADWQRTCIGGQLPLPLNTRS